MNATQRPTVPQLSVPEHTTFPPMSLGRQEGIEWAERLFCQARPSSGDAARFMKGLTER